MQNPVSETPNIGATVQKLLDALKVHPKKDQQTILKMVSQSCGLIAKSEFQPLPSTNLFGGRQQAPKTVGGMKQRPVVNNDLKNKRKEINDLNKRISEESTALGCALPDSHELIVKRVQLFRELKAFQNKAGSSADRKNGGSALSATQAGQNVQGLGNSESSSYIQTKLPDGTVARFVSRTPSPQQRGIQA